MSSILQPLASPMLAQGMQGSLSVFEHGGTMPKNDVIDGFLEKYKHVLHPNEYRLGGTTESEKPSIYVADLAAYNEGRLEGFWLPLTDYKSGAEVAQRISEFLESQSKKSGELREEYAIHDFENFPREMYSEYMTEEDFDKIIKAYEVQGELNIPFSVLLEFQREHGLDNLSEVKERFFTTTDGYDSDEDLGRAYVDVVGMNNIANKTYYFDFEEYGSDVRSDLKNKEENGEDTYEGVSDYDLGEEFIQISGGIDNASDSLIESYFDYAGLGSDLAINDFESYSGSGNTKYWFYRNYKKGGKLNDGGEMSESEAMKAAIKKVKGMSDDEVFDEIENVYYYEMLDNDISPEELRDDIVNARKALIEIYAEQEDDEDDFFGDGGSIGSIHYHKHNPNITFEILEYTNKGVKGLQRNPKSLSRKEKKEGIITYYSTKEFRDLFEKDKYNDGGKFESLEEVEKHAKKLSKTYGKVYILKRESGANKGEYVTATEDDLDAEMNSPYKSSFVMLYGNGKKYAEDGGMFAEGGMSEHGLKTGDKIVGKSGTKGVKIYNKQSREAGSVNLNSGKRVVKKYVGGGVTKNLKRVVSKGKKYAKIAAKKAKPTAKKIVKKAKIGFKALANKVAKAYEGKPVKKKYQSLYGKSYSKAEAKEVGNKVAAKVKRLKGM